MASSTNAEARLRTVLRHARPCPVSSRAAAAGLGGGGELRLEAGRSLTVGEDIMVGCAPINAQSLAPPTVHALLQAGVRHFDTAPLYGDSERSLGDAMASADPALSAGVQLYTKCGLDAEAADFTAPSIRRRFARSLARFHLDESGGGRPYTCHTLRVHHPALTASSGETEGDSLAAVLHPTEGAVAAMVGLRAEGAVEHVSMGMNTTLQHDGVGPTVGLLRAAAEGTFDSALLA